MTDDTKSTTPTPGVRVMPVWYTTAILAMFAGLLLAVTGGIMTRWAMIGASAVLLIYGTYCAQAIVNYASQAGVGQALDRGASMLAALRSQGN